MLRYVDTAQGVDVGLSLLTAGLAVARYDSTDGYPAHPRESDYHAAQVATVAPDGSVTTVACKAAADAAEQARIAAEQQAAEAPAPPPAVDEWWRQRVAVLACLDRIVEERGGCRRVRSRPLVRADVNPAGCVVDGEAVVNEGRVVAVPGQD